MSDPYNKVYLSSSVSFVNDWQFLKEEAFTAGGLWQSWSTSLRHKNSIAITLFVFILDITISGFLSESQTGFQHCKRFFFVKANSLLSLAGVRV